MKYINNRYIRILLIYFSVLTNCSTLIWGQVVQNKQIQFQSFASWSDILASAKRTDKIIFVDCFASWCLPCKRMDDLVFRNATVVDKVQDRVISVKIPFDFKDSMTLISSDDLFKLLIIKYDVKTLPTLLFFNSKGLLINRIDGELSANDFVNIVNQTLENEKIFDSVRHKTSINSIRLSALTQLYSLSTTGDQFKFVDSLSRQYIDDSINRITSVELMGNSKIEFIIDHFKLFKTSDLGFRILYDSANKVNKLLGRKGIAEKIAFDIIYNEEYNNGLLDFKKKPPKWNQVKRKLSRRYNDYYVNKAIDKSQFLWYTAQNDWERIIDYKIEEINKNGIDTTQLGIAFLNNFIWDMIFTHSTDKNKIQVGLKWSSIILSFEPTNVSYIDTYANLLYKSGMTDQAIVWQRLVIDLDRKKAIEKKRSADPSFKETLIKMNSGLPTWITD